MEGTEYFFVIISHALTVTSDYKQLRVYLEKSSSPLNKNKQTKKMQQRNLSLQKETLPN